MSDAGSLTDAFQYGDLMAVSDISEVASSDGDTSQFSLDDFSDIIDVVVGWDEVQFKAHACRLRSVSGFFKAILKQGEEQTEPTQTVILKKEDPRSFAVFMSWLLTGELHRTASFITETGPPYDGYALKQLESQWYELAECYVLGDSLQAAEFKNKVIDMLIENHRVCYKEYNESPAIHANSIIWVWQRTSDGSTLRELILDHASRHYPSWSLADDTHLPTLCDFLCELKSTLAKPGLGWAVYPDSGVSKTLWGVDSCAYHEHPGKPKDYSCSMD